MQANDPPRCLRFGVFEVDLRAGRLTKRGLRLRLQEQPFQVLAMLLEKPGELVTREELRSRLWPRTMVDFDHGLNEAIVRFLFLEVIQRRFSSGAGDLPVLDSLLSEPILTHDPIPGSAAVGK